MSGLEIKNVSFGYQKEVVKNLKLEIEPGEILGVLGENGSGKTTLLKGLLGEVTCFQGSVFYGQIDILHIKAKERAKYLGLLAHKGEVNTGLLVRDILEMGCYSRQSFPYILKESERNQLLAVCIELGIVDWMEIPLTQLSEGQKQLVQLGRLMVQDPEVLLLDEPDSALDYNNQYLLFSMIRKLVDKRKQALVIVHDPSTALRWCDKIILLKQGEVIDFLEPKKMDLEVLEEKLRKIYPNISLDIHKKSGTISCVCIESES